MINPDIIARIRADAFANSLGVTIEEIDAGYARASLVVREAMLNFHGITHGGIVFSLGDIAFAAAGNSRGQTTVALSITINFLEATRAGDHLVAEAREVKSGGATSLYDLVVTEKESGRLIAKSQALAYRKREPLV
jgi:acyl-CoA thioesterase